METMLFFLPVGGIIAAIGSFLVFTLPLFFQALVTDILIRRFGRRAEFGVLLVLPLTAVLAWYCYDYLTPTDMNLGFNLDENWTPYQHGLTAHRYLTMLTVQAPITLLGFWYCHATTRHDSRTPPILVALALAVVGGVIWGYWRATVQYQFL